MYWHLPLDSCSMTYMKLVVCLDANESIFQITKHMTSIDSMDGNIS